MVGCEYKTVSDEVIQARVMTKGEVESFSMGGAGIGYLIGGKLSWGIVGGLLAADGCVVPIMIDGNPAAIKGAPGAWCRIPGNTDIQIRRVKRVFDDGSGKLQAVSPLYYTTEGMYLNILFQ